VSRFRDEEADRSYSEGVIRDVCDDFDASLEAAANGSVASRYAAVPSWWALSSESDGPARPTASVPSWCIDARTARRLLSEIRATDSGSER
jgi:hypothetical protein